MRRPLPVLLISVRLLAPDALAQGQAPVHFKFNGTEYFHRWSQKGQNEFTPQGDEDLGFWRNMVTLNVHDEVQTGDELAQLANSVLGRYQATGQILRQDSVPRTKDREAEHYIAAVLTGPNVIEAAFARFLLVEKRGMVVVFSHRVHGPRVAGAMGEWLEENGAVVEKALMGWKGIPSAAALQALPQSPEVKTPSPVSPTVPNVVELTDGQAAVLELKARHLNPQDANQFVMSAYQGQADVVHLFLRAGMGVDQPSRDGFHALCMAVQGGYIDLAAELLKAGADPKKSDGEVGTTALIELAAYCDETTLFRALLKAGADPSAATAGGKGLSALQNAEQHGCTEMLRILKQAGAKR
jgi:hypothetical protein